MKIRRWSVGVLAASLLVPGLAACKSDSAEEPTAAGSPSAGSSAAAVPSDAKEALLASTKEISKGNFSFSITGGEFNGAGKVHMPTKSAEMTMTGGDASDDLAMEMHLVFIDTDTWAKIQFSGSMATAMPDKLNSGKYQHLDRSRIKGVDNLEFDFADVDPAGSEALTKAITEVRKTGEGLYAGTLDATKISGSDVLDEATVKALAGQATAVPFTAKLDAQGRLTELGIQVPAAGDAKAQDVLITYADYGATTAVQKPPADQVVEASDDVYEMFK